MGLAGQQQCLDDLERTVDIPAKVTRVTARVEKVDKQCIRRGLKGDVEEEKVGAKPMLFWIPMWRDRQTI